MNDLNHSNVVISFDPSLSNEQVSQQELVLIKQFLPDLLKEMIWMASEQED